MTCQRFEDLPVWQKAAELYEFTEDSLQNSDIKGPRHLNDRVRERERTKHAARDFRLNFLRNLKPDHPLYPSVEARAARGEPEEPASSVPSQIPNPTPKSEI